MGDFEHGPLVIHQGQAIKTHLSAWIDCHSRYIVEARYYVRENLDILVDSLLRAWGNHGASRELYVDNAKIYHAKALQLACTQLNIKLLHRPPRDPAPGGLIERFFQTCQTQFEAEVRASQILTLDELNRVLAAWLEMAYHQEVHSETGQTPHERYHQEPRLIRNVDLGTVLTFFHQRVPRKVDEDHLRRPHRQPVLRRRSEATRRPRDRPVRSLLAPWRKCNCTRPTGDLPGPRQAIPARKGKPSSNRTPAPPAEPITPHYLDALRAEHDAAQQQQRSQGIDFHSARQRNVWSLTGFAGAFARLLGRQGGVSGLSRPGDGHPGRLSRPP